MEQKLYFGILKYKNNQVNWSKYLLGKFKILK